MLPTLDTKPLQAEIAKDVGKVLAAHAKGIAALSSGDDATAALRALRPNIDAWAKRGTDAAAQTDPSKQKAILGANGWPGWTAAGVEYMRGIEALTHLGETATLDNIKATLYELPANTTLAAKTVATKVVQKTNAIATHAMDAASAAANFVTGLFGRAAIAAVAALALVVLVRGRR